MKTKQKVKKTQTQSLSAKTLLSKWILLSIKRGDFKKNESDWDLISNTLQYILGDSYDQINAAYSIEELEKLLHQNK